MTTVDFKRINLGHILTIITLIAGFVVFYGKMEARMASLETNIQWVCKALDMHIAFHREQVKK